MLAPIAGEVVERLVAPGQVLQAGATQCFTISNMNTVWVLANVYEHDLGAVHMGDPVIRPDRRLSDDSFTGEFHTSAPRWIPPRAPCRCAS